MTERLTLVIDRRAAAISTQSGVIRVDFGDGQFDRIPPALLESVVVHGSPRIDASALRLLARHNVPLAITPHRRNDICCWSSGGLGAFAHHRLAQYRAYIDSAARLRVAQSLLGAKLQAAAAQATFLEGGNELAEELSELAQCLHERRSIESLRGVEGNAARVWYAHLRESLDASWGFVSRNRRPPRDPVNALLSLSYTLALGAVVRAVTGAGYDPALGFLHTPAPARMSLALDLLEPLRPRIDRFVLTSMDTFSASDFTTSPKTGCRLAKEARGKYYSLWSETRRAWAGLPPDEQNNDVGASSLDASSLDQHCRQVVAQFAIWISVEQVANQDLVPG